MKYEIIFDECHGFKAGEIVEAAYLGSNVEYLLKVGAVREVKPEPKAEKLKA